MGKVWSDYSNRYIDVDQSISKTYDMIAQQFIDAGYRCVSRKHRIVKRIDRPDWVEYTPQGVRSVDAADSYRRCRSIDAEVISTDAVCKRIPTSNYDIADPYSNEPDIEEEEDTDMMNLTNVAALLRDDTTTIKVVHNDDTRTGAEKEYIYKILKTTANELKNGDHVIVKNSQGIRLAQVIEIHDEPQIDLESKGSKAINFRWAFQRVDTDTAEMLETQDREIVDRLKSRQVQNTRDQAMAMLGIADASEVLMGITDKGKTKAKKAEPPRTDYANDD